MQTMGKQTLNLQVSECHNVQRMLCSPLFSLKSGTGHLISILPNYIILAINSKMQLQQ